MTDLEKVQKDWKYLKKVKVQTEEVCAAAINQNKKAARYIINYDLYRKVGGFRTDVRYHIATIIRMLIVMLIMAVVTVVGIKMAEWYSEGMELCGRM